jgi:predicted nucleic acid-binding Zn finger protein
LKIYIVRRGKGYIVSLEEEVKGIQFLELYFETENYILYKNFCSFALMIRPYFGKKKNYSFVKKINSLKKK